MLQITIETKFPSNTTANQGDNLTGQNRSRHRANLNRAHIQVVDLSYGQIEMSDKEVKQGYVVRLIDVSRPILR